MKTIELVIQELSMVLCDLNVPTREMKLRCIERSLQSFARLAVSDHLAAPIREIQKDMAKFKEIISLKKTDQA